MDLTSTALLFETLLAAVTVAIALQITNAMLLTQML